MSRDDLVKRLRDDAEWYSVPPTHDDYQSYWETRDLLREAADALSRPVAAELPDKPPQFYAVKWHCGGEMFYAGNMLVVEKDRYNALRTAAEQKIAQQAATIEQLRGEVADLTKSIDENWVQHQRIVQAEVRVKVLEAALTELLEHFTRTPSSLADTNARLRAHDALKEPTK